MTITPADLQSFVQTSLLGDRAITCEENLLTSGLLDSLGVMTLVAHLEAETGAPIPPEDVVLENFASINAIIDYLGRRA